MSSKYLIVLQIEDGDIHASINQRDGMVSFHQNPEKYNNPKMLKKLDEQVRTFIYILNVWFTVKARSARNLLLT